MSPSRRFLLALALFTASATATHAQTNTGGIAGVVRDESGAPVAGATVTITDQRTGGIARILASGPVGAYAVPNLSPGLYVVSAALKGFATVTQSVRVSAGATMKADFTLSAKLEEAVTVTGTRVKGRTATETLAPVDVIDGEAIRATGATETGKILQLLEPSFNFSTTYISDGTDIIRPATLRSLNPDQVLVLVNGKRYHQQSLMNYQQTVARGSAGYDINSIPASAIDHIEVLRDGAAAQYGSDAIAGVINIILKKQTGLTDLTADAGRYYAANPELPLGASPDAQAGHGRQLLGSANTGFVLGNGGFVNLTFEYRDRGETNRAGPDTLRVSPPRVVQRIGDPHAKDALVWLNADVPAGGGALYAFGGYSYRKGNSSGFFRSAGDGRTVPALYPNGFLPTIVTRPTDAHAVLGYRADVNKDWAWDLSGSYGKSRFKFHEDNTINVSYFYEPRDPNGPKYNESPTSADTGALGYDQINFNLDLIGRVGWGVGAGPLNVATGAEWRREGYKIEAGEPVSYQYGRTNNPAILILDQTGAVAAIGTQGFPGYSPREAVDEHRSNVALYVDVESLLATKFLAGAAARYEHYSDFGSTLTGKLSGRYSVNDHYSLRGTLSTGFRAPGVQQEFYNSRSTNLNAAGVLTDTLTARQDSAVTRAFGIPPLKQETSRNYSVGLVSKPTDKLRLTVDLYRIDIDDRIIFSSNIQPEDAATCGVPFSASRCPIRAILDPFRVGQVQFFTNAIDTKTQGLDVVALYDVALGDSTLSLELASDFNKTQIKRRKSSSGILPAAVLFDQAQVTLVEEGQPRQHHIVGATYRRQGWGANVRFNYFGAVSGEGFTPLKQTWGGKWLTDASFTVPLRKDELTLTVGALNLFDVYPDKWASPGPGVNPFPFLGFTYGWETLPFGINGGYYYARINLRLPH
ncbi:MAG TPA: TonB-dependent receptor [Vicinamibacteria bacterium]